MLFNSYAFLFGYLPVTFAGFFILARYVTARAASVWLTLASLFFYGWWNPKFVALLLASIVFNYALAYAIAQTRSRGHAKGVLIFALTGNLLVLGVFKYAVGSSRVDLQACKLEYSIVSPK